MLICRLFVLWLGLGHLDSARITGAIDQLKKIQIVLFLLGRLPDLGRTVACELFLVLPRTYGPVGSGVGGEEGELNNRQKTNTAQGQIIKPLRARKRTFSTGFG